MWPCKAPYVGQCDHVTTGCVSIIRAASGTVAVLESDFSVDGAPAPRLGFSKAGEFNRLASEDGLQSDAIPASIDPSDYDAFIVWCADFCVSLGSARLN